MFHRPRGYSYSIAFRTILVAAAVATCLFGLDIGQAQQPEPDPLPASPDAAAAKKPKPKPRMKRADATQAPAATARDTSAAAPQSRICVVDRQTVDQQADINIASNKRLADLRAAAQADLDAAKHKIDVQIKTIDDTLRNKPSNAPALQQQRHALDEQLKGVASQAGVYTRDIEATRQAVTRQLTVATAPLVQAIAKRTPCAVVIAREAVVDLADAVDISKPIIDEMNAHLRFQPFGLTSLAGK